MRKVRTYNKISVKGLEKFSLDKYEIASEIGTPDAIMLRSHVLQPEDIETSVKAIGRAGAGVNNIPVENCTERGIVVFNAPGANANAVKELVTAALMLGSRRILDGLNRFAHTFHGGTGKEDGRDHNNGNADQGDQHHGRVGSGGEVAEVQEEVEDEDR